MKFSWSKALFCAVGLLSLIGLATLLATHPAVLMERLIIAIFVIGFIVFLFKAFTGQQGSDEAGYRRAVRQSKKRYREHGVRASHLQVIPSKTRSKKRPVERLKHRNPHHLTVIDGKKKRRKKLFFLE